MKINVLRDGYYTIDGTAALNIMQNKSMPILDLIVRESIQNSLDACLDNTNNVKISFNWGTFKSKNLIDEMQDIGTSLRVKCPEDEYNYLSIEDKNTVGLIGDLDGGGKNRKNQNLGNLVFNIMKPQQKEAAGGSWGIGKTVYFRLGIGVVIFYSRVSIGDGKYQQRLVASLVENIDNNELLKDYKDNIGIAFFGEYQNDKFLAITDDTYINNFLKIFDILPYSNSETGTKIIIPYVNEHECLKESKTNNNRKLWWDNSILNYLQISILRWYFGRMSKEYNYGPRLEAFINGEQVITTDQTILFAKFMELYSATQTNHFEDWIIKKEITRKKNDIKSEVIGHFVYGIVNKDDLLINKYHLPNIYQSTLIEHDENLNKPLIAFIRRPGMVAYYSVENNFTANNAKCNENEFIIGLFVLNSNNTLLIDDGINLDEYIRKSEKSDHASWEDNLIGKDKICIHIVQNIKKQIRECLEKSFGVPKTCMSAPGINMPLAKMFGKLLLPDRNFGNEPGEIIKDPPSRRTPPRKRNYKIELANVHYDNLYINMHYNVKISKKCKKISFINYINSSSKALYPKDYKEIGLDFPCEIRSVYIKCKKYNGLECDDLHEIQFKEVNTVKDLEISAMLDGNKCYGIQCINNEKLLGDLEFSINLKLLPTDKLIQAGLDIEYKEK